MVGFQDLDRADQHVLALGGKEPRNAYRPAGGHDRRETLLNRIGHGIEENA